MDSFTRFSTFIFLVNNRLWFTQNKKSKKHWIYVCFCAAAACMLPMCLYACLTTLGHEMTMRRQIVSWEISKIGPVITDLVVTHHWPIWRCNLGASDGPKHDVLEVLYCILVRLIWRAGLSFPSPSWNCFISQPHETIHALGGTQNPLHPWQ